MKPIVIIGSGMAGYTLAREFRKLNSSTPLLILTADDGDFYSKPMLSNALAQGKDANQLRSQAAPQMATQINARVLSQVQVNRIDVQQKLLHTSQGEFAYEKLVLAVGAQAIRLPIAGDAAHLVQSVNHLNDYAAFRQRLADFPQGANVVVLGAGLIGCEFADDLAGAGHQVTVVDPNTQAMAALLPAAIAQKLQHALSEKGVRFEWQRTAAAVHFANAGQQQLVVTLSDQSTLSADLVLSAVGLRPNLALANSAQLACERGILIDAFGRTSQPDIFALGDCAQYTNLQDGTQTVMPYIAPIMAAARAIARSLHEEATQIDLKPVPVIIKTPSCSIAVQTPPQTALANGSWQTEQQGNVTICRFVDGDQLVRGFAVAPQDMKLRTGLLAELGKPVATPTEQSA